MQLVLVMPAYNEQDCIGDVIRNWRKELATKLGSDFAILLVNDGSKDNTGKILDSLKNEMSNLHVIHQRNAGHGAALLNAYRSALLLNAEWIFHVDSDDQFTAADFWQLWNVKIQSNFLMGYRRIRHDAWQRLCISKILKGILFLFFGARLRDANIPYRLIKTSYLKKILEVLPPAIFAPNIFLAVLAAKDGQNLCEIPVEHKSRQTGKVSIVRLSLIKACFRSLKEL